MTDKLPDIMTEHEWEAFIGQFNLKAPTGLRNAAMFTIMHGAGLRACEVIGLRTEDIRQDKLADGRPVTALHLEITKGGKARTVFLPREADRLLMDWMARRRALGLGRVKQVFTTLKGAPVKDSYLREVCARKGRAAGIEWRVHPHALRHTFATNLLERERDLALVQDALGHASPETTRVYARVRNSRLAAAMVGPAEEAAGPGDDDRLRELLSAAEAAGVSVAHLLALAATLGAQKEGA